MPAILYFASILLTCALSVFLAAYAWRQRNVPGARAYAGLALSGCFLSLIEILSMLSSSPAQALFWFKARFLPIAVIPVFWLVFALQYSGGKDWLSKRLLVGLFAVPLITQVMLWSNSLHGLWVKHEVGFHQNGPFWIAETSARIPGLWFLVHSFYGLLLTLAGFALLIIAARRARRPNRGQVLLLTSAALTAFVITLIPTFNLNLQVGFNPFIPGIGLSNLLIALAVFRFQFLKRAPAVDAVSEARSIGPMAGPLFIFLLMTAGIAAVGYLSYQDYEQHYRQHVEDQLSGFAALKVDELQDWRRERLNDAALLYQNPVLSALVQAALDNGDARAKAELLTWLARIIENTEYDRVFLLDVAAVERLSVPAAPAVSEPVPAFLANQVEAVLEAGEVVFLDFHRNDEDGFIHLSLLAPIFSMQDGNRPLGILVLHIDPNVYLYPFIQQWPVPSTSAETLLIRREGTEALFLNELKFQTNTALNLRYPLSEAQRPAVKAALGEEGSVEGVDYRGVAVVAHVGAVPGSPWFLVVKMDTAEVYAPLRERQWQTLIFFAALIAASGAGLGLVWRHQRTRYDRGQVEAAQALRESEERYRYLLEIAPIGIFVHSEGKIVFINPAGARLFGADSDVQIIGKTLAEIIHPGGLEKAQARIQKMMTGEQDIYPAEVVYVKLDGTPIDVEVLGTTLPYKGKQAVQVIVSDITARKQAEAQILAAQADLHRLLAESDQSRRALLSMVEDQKIAAEEIRKLNASLEQRVAERTADLRRLVNVMAGREVRMAELKEVIQQLRAQLKEAGLTPAAEDPLAPL